MKEFFHHGNIVKVLAFSVTTQNGENHSLGINIQKIKEIVELQSLQPLPSSYFPFVGQYNLRGAPIPVIYLPHFFDNEDHYSPEKIKDTRMLICEFQKMWIGFIIHKTGKIHTLSNSLIKPVPKALDLTQKRLYNGVIELDDQFINLLDVELILDGLHVDLGFGKEVDPVTHFQGKCVLLVEDSKLFQKKLGKFFQKLGMVVTLAEDGEQGLETLRQTNKFDLIFTDIEMPHLNGIGMVRQIKRENLAPDIPIIFNTSISNPSLVKDIKDEDLGDYIVKFDEEIILNKLTTVLT